MGRKVCKKCGYVLSHREVKAQQAREKIRTGDGVFERVECPECGHRISGGCFVKVFWVIVIFVIIGMMQTCDEKKGKTKKTSFNSQKEIILKQVYGHINYEVNVEIDRIFLKKL